MTSTTIVLEFFFFFEIGKLSEILELKEGLKSQLINTILLKSF
jgi:hypothetical protein